MYEYIKGTLAQKHPTEAVIDVNGVGYLLKISLSTSQVLPEQGQEVLLKTYLYVREDILQLYGFSSEEERSLFTGLISVSGIGPKLAQTVLSGLTPDRFIAAVQQKDEITLSSISGIGKKTAQRLIVELKDKLGALAIHDQTLVSQGAGVMKDSIRTETLMALLSLGYTRIQADKALQKISTDSSLKTVEDMIRVALKLI